MVRRWPGGSQEVVRRRFEVVRRWLRGGQEVVWGGKEVVWINFF